MKAAKSGFLSVDNPVYDKYAAIFQAKTALSRILYIGACLLPGIVAYILVNIGTVHYFLTGYQYLAGVQVYHVLLRLGQSAH